MRVRGAPFVILLAAAVAGCGGEVPPDVAAEIAVLASASDDDRYEAIAALEELGPDAAAAVPALRDLLRATSDTDMQAEIAKALGSMGTAASAAVPDLVKLLASKDMWPRYTAAEALGSMGKAAAPALPALQRLLKDPDEDVVEAATEAVRRINRAAGRNPTAPTPAGR